MSELIKAVSPAEPIKAPASKEALLATLTNLEKEVMKHAGKPTFNPFLWVGRNITPLREALKAGATPAIAVKVSAIRLPPMGK